MSLRGKIVLIVGILITLLSGVLLFAFQGILVTSIIDQEKATTLNDTLQVYSLLQEKLKNLRVIAQDWAAWDDTYAFVIDQNPDYIESNLNAEALQNPGMDILLYVDTTGKIVISRSIDSDSGRLVPLPDSLLQMLKQHPALTEHASSECNQPGILLLPEGSLMMVACPIVRSDYSGPSRGSLIAGRFFDLAEAQAMSTQKGRSISIFEENAEDAPKDVHLIGPALNGLSPSQVRLLDAGTSSGYYAITDLTGKHLVLKVTETRVNNQRVLRYGRIMVITLMIAGLLFGALLLWLLNTMIIDRLRQLSKTLMGIGQEGSPSQRVNLPGNDELSRLAGTINTMLDSLEQTNRQRNESQARYQAVIEQSTNAILLADVENQQILDVNPACQKLLGFSRKELLAMHLNDLLAAETPYLFAHREAGGQNTQSVNGYLRTRDGSKVEVEVFHTCILLEDLEVDSLVLRDLTESRKIETEKRESEQYLAALDQFTRIAATPLDYHATLHMVSDQIKDLLDADFCYITNWNGKHSLQVTLPKGPNHASEHQIVQIEPNENTLTGSVLSSGQVLVVENSSTSPYISKRIADTLPGRSLLGIPLIVGDKKLGAAVAGWHGPHAFSAEEVSRAETAGGSAALAVAKAHLYDELNRSHAKLALAYDATIEGWSHALELRDRETQGHSQRVTGMTLRLAEMAGIDPTKFTHIRRGALLHDIGKLAIPDAILLKPGQLNAEEWVIMKKHPTIAYNLLWPIEFLHPAIDIPYCHHEKWDGSGYPRGLKGEAIPLPARIFSLVDVWDALTSDRPYRPAWSAEKTREYIGSLSGTQFDPRVVELFFSLDPASYQPANLSVISMAPVN